MHYLPTLRCLHVAELLQWNSDPPQEVVRRHVVLVPDLQLQRTRVPRFSRNRQLAVEIPGWIPCLLDDLGGHLEVVEPDYHVGVGRVL